MLLCLQRLWTPHQRCRSGPCLAQWCTRPYLSATLCESLATASCQCLPTGPPHSVNITSTQVNKKQKTTCCVTGTFLWTSCFELFLVSPVLQFVPSHVDVRFCNFSESVEKGLTMAFAEVRRRSDESTNFTVHVSERSNHARNLPYNAIHFISLMDINQE